MPHHDYTSLVIGALNLPGLIVIPAEIGAGKTLVTGAIADWFRRQEKRVAVLVPVQTSAERRREGLVSPEAEFLAACARSRQPLDLICPQRYHEPFIPTIAARRANRPLESDAIERAIRIMSRDCDVMLVQSPGPLMMPLDEKHAVLDLVKGLRAPAVIVTPAGLDAISPLLLTTSALNSHAVPVAGVVVNRYPPDTPPIDQELSLREFEKWSKLPTLCIVPDEPFAGTNLPAGITAAADQVDWEALASRDAREARGSERRG